jgi:hypothetical protein
MAELIQDTVLGHFLRLVTKQNVLPYQEGRDPFLWERYVDKEKSGNMARHGRVDPGEEKNEEKDEEANADSTGNNESLQPERTQNNNLVNTALDNSRNGSDTTVCSQVHQPYNEVSGVKVDPEKGRDTTIVTWYDGNDLEVGCIPTLSNTIDNLTLFSEPPKLVHGKEDLRYVLDLSFDIFGLYRIRHLLCWYCWRRGTLRC